MIPRVSACRRLVQDRMAFPISAVRVTYEKSSSEVSMLLALAVILLILAVIGGLVVHPLLFLIAILALLAFFASRGGAHF